MTTREKLIQLFESRRGEYFSGEEMAKELSVSRTAVWKAVKQLKAEGYMIDGVTNRGYALSTENDILSLSGVREHLSFDLPRGGLTILPNVVSTNTYVKEKAHEGAPHGYTLISNEQSGGRGRFGRNFHSPFGTGLYMSTLLRPKGYSSHEALNITTMAAVAMCDAITAVSGEKAEIKWVNDIYMRGKKVCGILTEGALDMESNMLEYAVLGVGVNVYMPKNGFPKEIERIAGYVFETQRDNGKNLLAAEFLNRFMHYYDSNDITGYIDEYKKRSLVIGKRITVISKNGSKSAIAIGIDDRCQLEVRYDDGGEETLSSGEISIKL